MKQSYHYNKIKKHYTFANFTIKKITSCGSSRQIRHIIQKSFKKSLAKTLLTRVSFTGAEMSEKCIH